MPPTSCAAIALASSWRPRTALAGGTGVRADLNGPWPLLVRGPARRLIQGGAGTILARDRPGLCGPPARPLCGARAPGQAGSAADMDVLLSRFFAA